jgi:hypothetical protein
MHSKSHTVFENCLEIRRNSGNAPALMLSIEPTIFKHSKIELEEEEEQQQQQQQQESRVLLLTLKIEDIKVRRSCNVASRKTHNGECRPPQGFAHTPKTTSQMKQQ